VEVRVDLVDDHHALHGDGELLVLPSA